MGFDNADWNAKASLAKKESFLHGTLLAVHQHFSDDTELDQDLSFLTDERFTVPMYDVNVDFAPNTRPLVDLLEAEHVWLEAAKSLLEKDKLEEQDYISW